MPPLFSGVCPPGGGNNNISLRCAFYLSRSAASAGPWRVPEYYLLQSQFGLATCDRRVGV
eukprot:scaffold69174_cov20-Cyclotella_meneghiniana.AAC.1